MAIDIASIRNKLGRVSVPQASLEALIAAIGSERLSSTLQGSLNGGNWPYPHGNTPEEFLARYLRDCLTDSDTERRSESLVVYSVVLGMFIGTCVKYCHHTALGLDWIAPLDAAVTSDILQGNWESDSIASVSKKPQLKSHFRALQTFCESLTEA
jgi:hypothetical protein